MSYARPNFDQVWWTKISEPVCIRNVWFFAVRFYCASQYELNSFVSIATYWVPELPNIKGFSGHLWHSMFIFANGGLYVWSSMHMNILARVCDTIECFLCWKSPTDWNKVGGDWKRVSCHGNIIFIVICVFRTISLPSFNGLWCKLAKIALLIYVI